MGKYAATGTGLSAWPSRKKIYTAAIVLAAIVVAVLITLGLISLDQLNDFIALVITLVGILGGVTGMVIAALARNNVEPPAE